MNCDRIAPFYRFFEVSAFGSCLQRHRVMYLKAAKGMRRALVLGDGDGRFTQALLAAYPDLQIDCIELSVGMVKQAAQRNVRMVQGDACQYSYPAEAYDVVFTHFFLDCFSQDQVVALVGRVSAALKPGAVWIISDFRRVSRGWRRVFTGAWLGTMYLFFRIATGLETQSLPDHARSMELAGFRRQREESSMFGLVASEWWQFVAGSR